MSLWSKFVGNRTHLTQQKEQEIEDTATYKPKDRRLYKYWDGQTFIEEDPMILYRKWKDVSAELETDIALAQSISKDAIKIGWVGMVAKIQKIFNVKSLAENGLTEVETSDLLKHFLDFCGRVKKNTKQTATLPETTLPSMPSISADEQTTQNTSVSGSIDEGKSTVTPPQLPTERQ